MTGLPDAGSAGIRIDVWLWAARFFKTRALAKQAIESGKVEINGQGCKPSRAVHVGDRLRVVRGEERFELQAAALSDRRGPASAAQQLYRENEDSIQRRAAEREQRRLAKAGFQPPKTRPDKRARRLIQALGDFDAT
jgi:ribosome-associated heat shock protein Hsp15